MASLQLSFELPPPAVTGTDPNASGTPFPMQASETVKSRRRSSAANGPQKDQFALPPPPTRSRKIIQMKPREEPAAAAAASGSKAASKGSTATGPTTPVAGTKRKQPSATSAAGRKIARKTAHSLIERRRRSKMNEEFAVLKSLIPACTGEMHKLAILQVGNNRVWCASRFPLTHSPGLHRICPVPGGLRCQAQGSTWDRGAIRLGARDSPATFAVTVFWRPLQPGPQLCPYRGSLLVGRGHDEFVRCAFSGHNPGCGALPAAVDIPGVAS